MMRTSQEGEHAAADAPAAAERRRLWQTLNPLHRKYVYLLARALAFSQERRRFTERLYEELRQHIEAIERLLDTFTPRQRRRTSPSASAKVDFEEPPA